MTYTKTETLFHKCRITMPWYNDYCTKKSDTNIHFDYIYVKFLGLTSEVSFCTSEIS